MTWRYQPVWTESVLGRSYSLCEVYCDESGRLDGWTESPAMTPRGKEVSELSADLAHMIVDTYRWEPVAFADLRVGMDFKRRITAEQAESLARLVESAAHNLKVAAAPVSPPAPGGTESEDR